MKHLKVILNTIFILVILFIGFNTPTIISFNDHLTTEDINRNVVIESYFDNIINISHFGGSELNSSVSYYKAFFPALNNFKPRFYTISFEFDKRLEVYNNITKNYDSLISIKHFPADMTNNNTVYFMNKKQNLGLFDSNENRVPFDASGLFNVRNIRFPIDLNSGNLTFYGAFTLGFISAIKQHPDLNQSNATYSVTINHNIIYENPDQNKVHANFTFSNNLSINDTVSNFNTSLIINNGFWPIKALSVYDNLRSLQFLLIVFLITAMVILEGLAYFIKRKLQIRKLLQLNEN